jgi:hypothetical protein
MSRAGPTTNSPSPNSSTACSTAVPSFPAALSSASAGWTSSISDSASSWRPRKPCAIIPDPRAEVSLLAYCIVPAWRAPPPGLAGVDDAAVISVPAGDDLACWASVITDRPAAATDALRRHNAVVAAAMDRDVSPVPLRFGQTFADAAAAGGAIARDAARWSDLLQRFAGRAEYGVRVSAALDGADAGSGAAPAGDDVGRAAAPAGAATEAARDVHRQRADSGRAHMEALARRLALDDRGQAAGERLAAEIRERAGGLIVDARQQFLRSEHGIVTLAYLVAWSDADAYHAVMQNIRGEHGDLRLLLSGPWPPYSFVA